MARYEIRLLIGVRFRLVGIVSSLVTLMVLPAIATEVKSGDSQINSAVDRVASDFEDLQLSLEPTSSTTVPWVSQLVTSSEDQEVNRDRFAAAPEFSAPGSIAVGHEDPDLAPLSTNAAPVPQSESPQPKSSAALNSLGQVTSVSQLSDVQATDWAFQALQSLVERYGCIVGYPDSTYKGRNALTRYEFAAGLNACLDRISELIASSTANLATQEDLATLQRLQTEFASELASLRGRVDSLEARTSELEAHQFSTTTKLSGEVIFSVAGATGGYPGAGNSDATPALLSNTGGAAGDNTQIALNNRVRLNLTTSFTGKDALVTGLQSHNFGSGFGLSGSLPSTLGLGDPVFGTASHASLGYAPQFGRTAPERLVNSADNDVQLYKLLYLFPVAQNFSIFIAPKAETSDAFPAISPFASDSQGAISRFAGYNAAYRISAGTSGIGQASVVGFVWNINDAIDWRAFYGVTQAAVSVNRGLTGGTPLGAGLFNGTNVIATQLTLRPSKALNIGLNYANSYHQINILGTGLTSADVGSVVFTPNASQLAAVGGNQGLAVVNEGIRINSFGGTVTLQFSPQVALTASGAYILADLVKVDASTNFVSWLVGLHFRDVFGEGNSAGLIFGQPLNRDSTGGRANNPENADPYQVEGYLTAKLSDNISLTPGVFVIFNPEGYSGNDTTVVGVLRTTFTF